jgi:hypothetical protein
MAWTSGTASSQADLLSKLLTWCTTHGWTVNETGQTDYSFANTSRVDVGQGQYANIQKTDSYGQTGYINLYAAYDAFPFPTTQPIYTSNEGFFRGVSALNTNIRGLVITGSRGYDAGASEWYNHPTTPPTENDNLSAGSTNGGCISMMFGQSLPYWFFAHGDAIIVVVELFENYYGHMHFGTLVKSHPYTGGHYYQASMNILFGMYDPYETIGNGSAFPHMCYGNGTGSRESNCGVYSEMGAGTQKNYWGIGNNNETIEGSVKTNYFSLNSTIYSRSWCPAIMYGPNTASSLAVMQPIYYKRSIAINGRDYYLGYPEGIRFLNVINLPNKYEFSLGSDDWISFPCTKKWPASSGYLAGFVPGIAVKK